MIVSIIVAVSENNVIGKNNQLVWHLPDDMKFFTEKTMGHHVIMGRRNYESIPEKYRPLPGRTNIVVTRNQHIVLPGCKVVHSIEQAIALAKKNNEEEAFIIGGGQIYSLSLNYADKIYFTEVKAILDGDTFFLMLNKNNWEEISRKMHKSDERHAYDFEFVEYIKK